MGRCFNNDANVLVALPITLDILNTFARQSKDLSRLGSAGNFHFYLSVQCRHIDFGAQGGLREIDWDLADDIETFPVENRVRFNLNDHVKIAGLSAVWAEFTFPSQFKPRPGIYSCGNFDAQSMELAHSPGARAGCTGDRKSTRLNSSHVSES